MQERIAPLPQEPIEPSPHKSWHELVNAGPRKGSYTQSRSGEFYSRTFPTVTAVIDSGTEFKGQNRAARRHMVSPQGRRLFTGKRTHHEDVVRLRNGGRCYVATS